MSLAPATIDEALQGLRALIYETVKAEQLRDQLTGLPNDAALTEFLSTAIDQKRSFWIAFVEIDYFKRINDEFGYETADGLLKAIAKHLQTGRDFFVTHAQPFRAHGDEFFIAGKLDESLSVESAGLAEALEQIRSSIAAIRIAVSGKSKPMTCTVSVGWLTSQDGQESDLGGLTARNVRILLERAVAEAKRGGRDRVVRYDRSMTSVAIIDYRASCPACQASFTAAIPHTSAKTDPIFCPNCGTQSKRPIQPELAPPPIEVEE